MQFSRDQRANNKERSSSVALGLSSLSRHNRMRPAYGVARLDGAYMQIPCWQTVETGEREIESISHRGTRKVA